MSLLTRVSTEESQKLYTRGNIWWYAEIPLSEKAKAKSGVLQSAEDKVDSIQKGRRPVVICQSDWGQYSPAFTIAPISKQPKSKPFPFLQGVELSQSSQIHYEQLTTVSRKQLVTHIGCLSKEEMMEMDMRLAIPLDLAKSSILHIKGIKVNDSFIHPRMGRVFKGEVSMAYHDKYIKFTETEFINYFGPEAAYYLQCDYTIISEYLERLAGLKFVYTLIDRKGWG